MDHHSVPHIDAHMGNARRVISALEKDQIAGARGTGAGTDVIEPLGPQAAHVPAGVIDYPGHKAGAVKGRGRGAPAPYIGIAQVFSASESIAANVSSSRYSPGTSYPAGGFVT